MLHVSIVSAVDRFKKGFFHEIQHFIKFTNIHIKNATLNIHVAKNENSHNNF